MKTIQLTNTIKTLLLVVFGLAITSCDYEFELPEAGSVADETPPTAAFSYTQGVGAGEEWKDYTFANQSSSSTMYAWNFGDGGTSTATDPVHTFAGEGTYTVTLVSSDNLGVTSTSTQEITIVEPEVVLVPDPTLVNADFNKLPKSSGSDCSCSGWINKDIGDQGESSSGNGGSDNVVKFDNNEPDIVYQEFEVVPNAEYQIQVVTSFKDLVSGGSYPSIFELRVLAGSGYVSGYSPTYYTNTVDMPQEDWGYTSVSQVEDAVNNLLVETVNNPGDTEYYTQTYTFNAGANTSVAIYMRGIGGPATGGGGNDFGFNSGDEEIRADSVIITALN